MLIMVSTSTFIVLVLSLFLGALYQPSESNGLFATKEYDVVAKNILLVTAHPDDESLFFAPTILAFAEKSQNASVDFYQLCLSTGNAEGLGETRKTELSRSLNILGVPEHKRWVIDHPELQDNMTIHWDADVIATVLKKYVSDHKIDTILTFDERGISSHPNHKSIPTGVQALIKNLGETPSNHPLRLFTLVTTPLPYKYLSFTSVGLSKAELYAFRGMRMLEPFITKILSTWSSEISTPVEPLNHDVPAMALFVSNFLGYQKALESMQAHESQLVWYRYLNVAFSKYLWVNAYVELKV